jgi:hypothetical protein
MPRDTVGRYALPQGIYVPINMGRMRRKEYEEKNETTSWFLDFIIT